MNDELENKIESLEYELRIAVSDKAKSDFIYRMAYGDSFVDDVKKEDALEFSTAIIRTLMELHEKGYIFLTDDNQDRQKIVCVDADCLMIKTKTGACYFIEANTD